MRKYFFAAALLASSSALGATLVATEHRCEDLQAKLQQSQTLRVQGAFGEMDHYTTSYNCPPRETAVYAYVPSSDRANCQLGYICERVRTHDGP